MRLSMRLLPLLLCCFGKLAGQPTILSKSTLPIVVIETQNGVKIPDEPKVEAHMKIIHKGDGQINQLNDLPNIYDAKIAIEIRGSTSQLFYEKKPYSLELRDETGADNPQALLGMPKEEDWALIQPLNDKSLMRDMLAYRLAGDIMPWAPRSRYVEVVINDSYEGVYMLAERIKRDKNRVNIAKLEPTDTSSMSLSGGYILAFDKIKGSPGGSFGGDWILPNPPYPGAWQRTAVQIKYPQTTDITTQQRLYIENKVNAFDALMAEWTPNQPGVPPYQEWIDAQNWVDYLLVNEITKNVDGYRLSAWFYKDRDSIDHRFKQGPVWDYNIAFGIGDYCGGSDWSGWVKDFNEYCGQDLWVIHFWWEKLCRDHEFQQLIRNRWHSLRQSQWSDNRLKALIDSTAALLNEAQGRNFQRWPVLNTYVWPNAYVGNSYTAEVNYLKNWLLKRAAWMDENIAMIGPTPVRDILNQEGPIAVFPNPVADNLLMFEYDFPEGAKLDYRLIDTNGRIVLEGASLPTGKPMHINVNMPSFIPRGCYVLQLYVDGQLIQTAQIIR